MEVNVDVNRIEDYFNTWIQILSSQCPGIPDVRQTLPDAEFQPLRCFAFTAVAQSFAQKRLNQVEVR